MRLLEPEQLLLPFDYPPIFSFDNFIVGPENRLAYHAIKELSQGSSEPGSLVLVGDGGTGKTHLLSSAIAKNQENAGSCVYLHTEELKERLGTSGKDDTISLLLQYQNYDFIALDSFDALANSLLAQEVVIYLYNMIAANRGRLVIASRTDPGKMRSLRPELKSRLLWGKVLHIYEPSDAQLGLVLHKIAKDRNICLSEELVHFLLMRLSRSVCEYERVIRVLDQKSSKLSRNISILLAKELFGL
ncbi:MAG: DnaA/Hda family protein [Magnetococcus sp. THC-1_WYH]